MGESRRPKERVCEAQRIGLLPGCLVYYTYSNYQYHIFLPECQAKHEAVAVADLHFRVANAQMDVRAVPSLQKMVPFGFRAEGGSPQVG